MRLQQQTRDNHQENTRRGADGLHAPRQKAPTSAELLQSRLSGPAGDWPRSFYASAGRFLPGQCNRLAAEAGFDAGFGPGVASVGAEAAIVALAAA